MENIKKNMYYVNFKLFIVQENNKTYQCKCQNCCIFIEKLKNIQNCCIKILQILQILKAYTCNATLTNLTGLNLHDIFEYCCEMPIKLKIGKITVHKEKM